MDQVTDKLVKKIEDNDDITRLANRALKNLNGMQPAEAQNHASSVAKSVNLHQEEEEAPSVDAIAEEATSAYGNDAVNKLVNKAMEKVNDGLSFEDREEARKLAAQEIQAGLKKSDKEPAQNLVQAGWGMDF